MILMLFAIFFSTTTCKTYQNYVSCSGDSEYCIPGCYIRSFGSSVVYDYSAIRNAINLGKFPRNTPSIDNEPICAARCFEWFGASGGSSGLKLIRDATPAPGSGSLVNIYYDIYDQMCKCFSDTAENCHNAIDDDLDGMADCEDPECKTTPDCKETECINCCGSKKSSEGFEDKTSQSLLERSPSSGDQCDCPPAKDPCEETVGDPIEVNSGLQTQGREDINVPGRFPLVVRLNYRSLTDFVGVHGSGYNSWLTTRIVRLSDSTFVLRDETGGREEFDAVGKNLHHKIAFKDLVIAVDSMFWSPNSDRTYAFSRADGVLREVRSPKGGGIRLWYNESAGKALMLPIRGISNYSWPDPTRGIVAMEPQVTRLSSLDDPSKQFILSYDLNGFLSTVTDFLNRVVRYSYDSSGNQTMVEYPDHSVRRYLWEDSTHRHRLTRFDAISIAPSRQADTSILTRNVFDGKGRVQQQTHRKTTYDITRSPWLDLTEHEVTLDHTATLRIHTYIRESEVKETTPGINGGQIARLRKFQDKVINQALQRSADGQQLEPMYWVSRKVVETETIGGGSQLVAETEYDRFNNISRRKEKDGTIVENVRDEMYRIILQKETPPPPQSSVRSTRLVYKGNTDLVERKVLSSSGDSTIWVWTYDDAGRILSETISAPNRPSVVTSKIWDSRGRLASVTDPSGSITTYVYLNSSVIEPDSVTFADGTGERYTRDAAGMNVQTRNHLGRSSRTWYDLAGRDTMRCGFDSLCTRSRYDGPDLVGIEDGIRLASDGSKTSPMRVRKFEVDGYGRRVKELLQSGSRWILVRKSVVDSWGNEVEAWDNPDSTNTDSTRWRLIERNVYDGLSRRLERRTFPNGRFADSLVERYAYDAIGNLVSSTDARGQTTTRTVDPWGNVLSETDPLGRTSTRTYDHGNRVLTETDVEGRISRHVYDASGNETRRVGPVLDTTHWVYEGGLLRKERSPEGSWTTYHYDSRSRLSRVVRKVGDSTLVPDANDVVTGYAYDAVGNRICDTVAGVVQHRLAYDAGGRVVRDTNALGPVTETRYDDLGRVTTVILHSPDTLLTRYDPAGRVSSRILHSQGKSPDTLSLTRYDDANRPVWERTPGSGAIEKVYDGTDYLLRATDSLGRVTNFVQDGLGRDSTTSVAGGPARRTVRDAVGRVVEQWDERGNRIRMVYDNLDRLTSLIDNENNATTFTWIDTANGWTKRITTYPDNKMESHYWDREGRMLRTVDGRNMISRNFYDSLGRVVKILFHPSAVPNVTDSILLRHDAWGRLVKASQGTSWDSADYDVLGRVTKRYQRIDGTTYTLGYAYDMGKRLRHLTLPDGSSTLTFYSARGLVESIQMSYKTVAWFAAKNGFETGRSYANGTGLNSFYRKSGEVSAHTWVPLGKNYPYLEYGYDAYGNRTLLRRKYDSTRSESMTYTPDHQLSSWRRGKADAAGTIASPSSSQSWANLDSRGNWNIWHDGGGNQTRVHSGANEIQNIQTTTGTSNIVWDDAGNRLSDGAHAFAWNIRGFMDTVKRNSTVIGAYGYDALGRRNLKVADGRRTVFIYDGWQCVYQKVTGSGTDTTKAFVYANYIDEPVNMVRKWGSTSDTVWYQQGNNFNVEALTDHTGAIVERYEYTPYGTTTIYTGAGSDGTWFTSDDVVSTMSARGNSLTFQGREFDVETGLYYFRNRYYMPSLGRFVSRDPKGLQAFDINYFRFEGSSPMNVVDPLGLEPCGPTNVYSKLDPETGVWTIGGCTEEIYDRSKVIAKPPKLVSKTDECCTNSTGQKRNSLNKYEWVVEGVVTLTPGPIRMPPTRGHKNDAKFMEIWNRIYLHEKGHDRINRAFEDFAEGKSTHSATVCGFDEPALSKEMRSTGLSLANSLQDELAGKVKALHDGYHSRVGNDGHE